MSVEQRYNDNSGTSGAVTVREALPEDAAALSGICVNEMGYECTEALVFTKLQGLRPDRECVYIAACGDSIAGFVHVEKYDVLYFETMANILGLAVRSDCQRRGIGSALLRAADDWARARGISVMRLNSGAGRAGAHAFYRDQGYTAGKEQLRFLKTLE